MEEERESTEECESRKLSQKEPASFQGEQEPKVPAVDDVRGYEGRYMGLLQLEGASIDTILEHIDTQLGIPVTTPEYPVIRA